MSEYVSVYATFASAEQARTIGRTLVAEGLAACINILPAVQSIYRWEGKLEEDTECAFFAKTQRHLTSQLTARIVQLHSYQTPCVVVLPIIAGHQPYLDWITQATTPSP